MATIVGKNNSSKLDSTSNTNAIASLVYMNDGVSICSEACACCWDKPIPESYEDKVEYLGKRAKIGHTSIFEHSNIITVVKLGGPVITSKDALGLADSLSCFKYLNVVMRQGNDNIPYLLIGGSYRGYDAMFHLSNNSVSNTIIRAITPILYQNVNSKIFYDLTKENILAEEAFANVEPDPASIYFNDLPEETFYESDKVKFISVDNINQIRHNLIQIIGADIFSNEDISRVATLSILFKDMSRTATHQLVRHRNAITQESQRYVDYSEAAFADPTTFKPDRYDPNKKYEIHFGGQTFSMTSMELGEAIIGTYEDMRNQGMMKEDARSFLPGNVKCRKLYMTSTYSNFMKFLELRCDPHAQAEIRSFAIDCRDASQKIFEDLEKDVDTAGVDEIITDKEVILNNIVENTPELKEDK